MAELLSVSPSTYSRLERNETSVDFDQLSQFSKTLNIPIQDFLPDTISVDSHHNTQGGVVFGNYHYYSNPNAQLATINQEFENLKIQLNSALEQNRALQNQLTDYRKIIDSIVSRP